MVDPNGILGTLFAPVVTLFGGEYKVHIIHHYIVRGFLFFTIVHVYMASPRRRYGGIRRSICYGFRHEVLCT